MACALAAHNQPGAIYMIQLVRYTAVDSTPPPPQACLSAVAETHGLWSERRWGG